MIEVQNINPINKGSLLATCSVYIKPWHLTMHEVKIFQKGTNRWLGMPAKEAQGTSGEKTYVELITFDAEVIKNKFRSQIMGAVDKFLAGNPDMKTEDVIKEEDDSYLPF